MSAARLALAAGAFAVCAVFGTVRRAEREAGRKRLESVSADISALRVKLADGRLPLGRIASELAASGQNAGYWRGVSEAMARGLSFGEAAPPVPGLDSEADEILRSLFAGLGDGSLRAEEERIERAERGLRALLEKRTRELEKRGGLINSLSLLAGLAAALLIL